MDREKVISWLEGLAEDDWRECYSDSEVQETARQALDLIDELLKEQEAVIVHDPGAYCPKCGWMLYIEDHPNHCGNCGQAVKWNA